MPSDAIWRHTAWSTLAQVAACCLTASHYLNQWRLVISEHLWESSDRSFTANAWNIYSWYEFEKFCFNPSPPSAAYMRQWIGWSLIHMMACRLFGAKPLSEPMLGHCQLRLLGTNSWMSVKIRSFSFKNSNENVVCQNSGHFVQGGWVNTCS